MRLRLLPLPARHLSCSHRRSMLCLSQPAPPRPPHARSQTPAAAALLASLAAANARLEPLYAVLAALQRQWQDLIQL